MTALAALLLSAALFLLPSRSSAGRRLAALRTRDRSPRRTLPRPAIAAVSTAVLAIALLGPMRGAPIGASAGVIVFLLIRRWYAHGPPKRRNRHDELALAGSWDLFAACLRGGLPVPDAVRAIAGQLPDDAADALRRTAELIALGADPVAGWEPAMAHPATAELARAARRTARSGAALADTAEALATTVRSAAGDLAEAHAQRIAVAVTGPLGLCFLPAFLCLGVAPVVVGLVGRLMVSW